MKKIEFNLYGKKQTIFLSRDLLKKIIGLIFIFASAGLLGVLKLFEIGWNWDFLKNTAFWSDYFIRLGLFFLALFGAYVFRRSYDVNSPKIQKLKTTIRYNKSLIADASKTEDCENYLKNVFNYEKKLEIYKRKLQQKNANLSISEVKKPELRTLNNKFCNFFAKIMFKFKMLNFKIKTKRLETKKRKRAFLERQLEIVKVHYQIIGLYKDKKYDEADKLYATIQEEDQFKYFMPRFKELTFNKLFNVSIEKSGNEEDFEYHEAGTLFNRICRMASLGCIFLAIIMSITLSITDGIDLNTILFIVLNLILMLWYVLNGILAADRFVFGNVLQADENRIRVCNLYRDNCKRLGEDWVKGFKTEEKEEGN